LGNYQQWNKSLDFRRNIQISLDGPNVDLKFVELVNEVRCVVRELCQRAELIFVEYIIYQTFE